MTEETSKPNKTDIIEQLDSMIANLEALPDYVMNTPITHYDFVSALWLLVALYKQDKE